MSPSTPEIPRLPARHEPPEVARHAGEAIFLMDTNGRVTYLNPAAEAMFGWPRDELLGRVLHDTVHARRPDGTPYPLEECPIGAVTRTGVPVHAHEDIFFARDGRPVAVRCSNAPVVEDGRLTGAVLVVSDVSEERAAGEAAREQRRFLDAVVEVAPYALYVFDLVRRRPIYLTPHAAEVLGRPVEELATAGGAFFARYLHPEDRPRVEAHFATVAALADGEVREVEYRMRHADGRWRRFRSTDRVFRRGKDGSVRELIGVAVDITEQVRLHGRIRAQFEELETLYRTAPIGLALLDADGRFVRINERLAEMNGVPAAAHIGRAVRDVVPAIADQAEEAFRRVFSSGEPVLDIELKGETAAEPGAIRWWRESWYPLRDGSGATVAVSVVVQEVTERKRAEAERERLLRALAHDFKNPIAGLQLQAQQLRRQVLRRGVPEREELLARLAAFEALAGRMRDLVDDLGDLARLAAGEPLELRRTPIDLVALARAAIEEAKTASRRHAIALEDGIAPVVGAWDERRLRRVIGNLLDNAIKYSPDGGTVAVRVRRDGDEAELAIRDEGIGIPASDLVTVFGFQFRAGNVGPIPGSGIGLAGAKWIVEQHGGTIAVASVEGRGSTFTVRLPLGAPQPGAPG